MKIASGLKIISYYKLKDLVLHPGFYMSEYYCSVLHPPYEVWHKGSPCYLFQILVGFWVSYDCKKNDVPFDEIF